jgi:hypothetical protein
MKETIMEPAYSPFLAVEKGNMCLGDASGLDRVVTIKELAHFNKISAFHKAWRAACAGHLSWTGKGGEPPRLQWPCVFVNGFVSCPQF